MKKILCSDKTCIHNEDIIINNTPILVCKRCDDIMINSYRNTCNGYEEIEKYLNRISK